MGLKGNLNTICLADVMQWVSMNRKTGILHLLNQIGISQRVYFQDGMVCSTASSEPNEYLGHFLISRGYLNEGQLCKAMETQLKTGIKLGKILVAVGIIDEPDLQAMLTLKAQENIYQLFRWAEGEFSFEELQSIDEEMIHIALEVTMVVMEGIRRSDEWERILKVIPSGDVVLARTVDELAAGSSLGGDAQARLFAAVDGERRLASIVLDLHATEYVVFKAAFQLVSDGAAKVAAMRPGRQELALTNIQMKMLVEAEAALGDERFGEALRLFQFLFRKNPEDKRVVKGLALAEEGTSRVYFRDVVPIKSVLELSVPIEKLTGTNLTPEEGFLISRVNGSWDIGAILKVAPMAEGKTLRTIRRLLEKGILKVRSR